jgi:hypothetical protein
MKKSELESNFKKVQKCISILEQPFTYKMTLENNAETVNSFDGAVSVPIRVNEKITIIIELMG